MRKYKKSYRTKKKKHFKILKNKFFWFSWLIVFMISGLVYLFAFSSVFKIKDIQVSGYESASVKDIISNTAKNIFITHFSNIRQQILDQYPKIKDVKLKRKFPNKIVAEIEERKPVAIFYYKPITSISIIPIKEDINEYFLVDNQGIVFEKISEKFDLPLIELNLLITRFDLGRQAIEKETLDKILSINFQDLAITKLSIVSNKRLDVKTVEGWYIYFNLEDDLSWQIEELNILLKQRIPSDKRRNLEYIDLRFEKVYVYPDNYLED